MVSIFAGCMIHGNEMQTRCQGYNGLGRHRNVEECLMTNPRGLLLLPDLLQMTFQCCPVGSQSVSQAIVKPRRPATLVD